MDCTKINNANNKIIKTYIFRYKCDSCLLCCKGDEKLLQLAVEEEGPIISVGGNGVLSVDHLARG